MAIAKKNSTVHPSGDKRFRMLSATMKRYQYAGDALIEVLHQAQELFGYLEEDLLLYIAHRLQLYIPLFSLGQFCHYFLKQFLTVE